MQRDSGRFDRFVRDYWGYYRELEQDFLATRKYVSFDTLNFATYSMEYLKLFQAVCSEIDVVGKAMAFAANDSFSPDDRQNNIFKWWFEIQDTYFLTKKAGGMSSGYATKVTLPDSCCTFLNSIELRPWKSFRTEWYRDAKDRKRIRARFDSTPAWWSSYNKVKHSRMSPTVNPGDEANYTKANLGNVLSAFAGLFLLETAYMETIGTENDYSVFNDRSCLFEVR